MAALPGRRWLLRNGPRHLKPLPKRSERGFELLRAFPSTGEHVPFTPGSMGYIVSFWLIRYHLYYTVSRDTETIEILSLWHTSRGSAPVF